MPEITWQPVEKLSGYTDLIIDGRIRGYVEHATCLPFWNFLGATAKGQSFTAIARHGEHPTVASAMDALAGHVQRMDAVCDGRMGIQGKHVGCHPSRCKPETKEA